MNQTRTDHQEANFVDSIREGNERDVRRILWENANNNDALNLLLTKKYGQFKQTALHLAVKYGDEGIVKDLLDYRADVRATDLYKRTVLHTAADANKGIHIMTLILRCEGVDVNAIDRYGNTPVKLAAEGGNSGAVRLLMENGADITIADKGENTTLHVAAKHGHIDVLELLLEKLAHKGIIGKQNKDKNTPLHLAVESKSQECVALLLSSGATSTMAVKNQHDQTAAELAKEHGNKGIIKLLDNPQKARELTQKKTMPSRSTSMPQLGKGFSVEAHSLVGNANQLYIYNQYTTNVHNVKVAVGPFSQVVENPAAMGLLELPLASTGESHYDVQVNDGNVSVGDYSNISVGTITSRTPSTAGSSDVPFSFPHPQENRDTSTELVTGVFPSGESSGAPTDKSNPALSHPVQEENPKDKTSSVQEENPTEKVNTSFSCPIQEESPMEKPNASLSSPVQEQLSDLAKEHDNKEITKLLENPQNAREFLLPRSTSIPQLGRGVSVEGDILDESSLVRATMEFEAEHDECLYVCPYLKDGEVVVNLYVYNGKSGIPTVLKTAAQEFFGEMGLKLKWNDLYNDAYNILNVAPIEYPSGEPKRLQASQIEEINEIINENLQVFSKHRNITALQPSLKITKSMQTEEACITVYVLGKGSIPMGESAIPCAIGSYPVDIVNGFCVRTKEPSKPTKAQKQKEVLRLGASIGVDGEKSSGTLGAVVEDANSGTLYALSCDHVMNHADKSEIIHPGLDVYLNYLHYHLNEYKKWIDRITEPDCELPQIPVDIHQEPAELLSKFIELKAIKELHGTSTRSSKDIMKGIMKHEKKLEKGFSKQPRIIANYTAGIRHNVASAKNSVKKHFVDAAISELKDDEEKKLRRSKTTEIIESGHYPSGDCTPATTKATMNVEELFKSGSATGFTESSLLLGVSISPPMTIKAFRQQGESAWMDVKCIICKEREAAQSQVQELASPCELCKPDKWLKSCLCIQKQGPRLFSDHGDSGAVIFEKRRKENGEDYETACPGFGIIFAVHKSSYFDFTIASPLEVALEALSQEVSNSRPDRRPCELRLTSRFNTN